MADQAEQPVDQNNLIQQFCSLVTVSPEQARQYLEVCNWDLHLAMDEYFNSTGGQDDDDDDGDYESEPETKPAASAANPKTNKSSGPKSKLVTLGDLQRGASAHDSGSEDEDPNVQKDFFAGGEKSGLAVKNPKAADKAKGIINDLLKKGAEHQEQREPTAGPSRSRFTGGGQTLGSDDSPSVAVPDPNAQPPRDEVVTRTLTFWREGFSVEDGPLMRYDDPANQEVLQSIQNGRAPIHLMNLRPGQHADVHVYKRMEEDYVPPKKKAVPFSGKGNRLGSPAPELATGSGPSSARTATPAAAAPAVAAPSAPPVTVEVDASQPTTSIQIRLGDGSRHVSRFNHTHTVGDIYNFVNAASTASRSRNYVLQTTFPNKELKDHAQTLKDAGLINAVVVQKWC